MFGQNRSLLRRPQNTIFRWQSSLSPCLHPHFWNETQGSHASMLVRAVTLVSLCAFDVLFRILTRLKLTVSGLEQAGLFLLQSEFVFGNNATHSFATGSQQGYYGLESSRQQQME